MKPNGSSKFLFLLISVSILLAACSPGSGNQAPVLATQVFLPAVGNPVPATETPVPATKTPVPATKAPQAATATYAPLNIGGIAVLGDSTSDEYRADDNRGGEYAATTLNWVEQLVKSRNLDFGKWGTWGGPRRTGYEYNWALTGATSQTMRSSGQAAGVAQQVAEGKVSYAILWIGGNDFHLRNGPYEDIYSGKLSGSALQEKLDSIASIITRSMDIILAAGEVKMAVVTVTDQGLAKGAPALFPDANKRQRVTDAINSLNAKITEEAISRGVIVVDSNQLALDLFARYDSEGFLNIGGQKINGLEQGNDPYHVQLGDHIGHSGTVLSGLTANMVFIEPFNEAFGLGIPPLTDEEILKNAGILK